MFAHGVHYILTQTRQNVVQPIDNSSNNDDKTKSLGGVARYTSVVADAYPATPLVRDTLSTLPDEEKSLKVPIPDDGLKTDCIRKRTTAVWRENSIQWMELEHSACF